MRKETRDELEEITEEIIEEKKEAPESPKKEMKKETLLKKETKKAKVFKIKKDVLLLEDEMGHGINIPKTKEHKNVKLGDIIEF
jgi:hypothetical protein